jgi:hypothetical protein
MNMQEAVRRMAETYDLLEVQLDRVDVLLSIDAKRGSMDEYRPDPHTSTPAH